MQRGFCAVADAEKKLNSAAVAEGAYRGRLPFTVIEKGTKPASRDSGLVGEATQPRCISSIIFSIFYALLFRELSAWLMRPLYSAEIVPAKRMPFAGSQVRFDCSRSNWKCKWQRELPLPLAA